MWKKIEVLLIERNMNQNQLAIKTGISAGTITDLKMGRIKKPSFEFMCKIADALDVSLDVFRREEMNEMELTAKERFEMALALRDRQKDLEGRIERFEQEIDFGKKDLLLKDCLSNSEKSLKTVKLLIEKLDF